MNSPPDGFDGDSHNAGASDAERNDLLNRLQRVLIELQSSTHGGPRQSHHYDSLKRLVERHPKAALLSIDRIDAGHRPPLLMSLSALGRRILPDLMDVLRTRPRSEHALVLYMLTVRGMVGRIDRDDLIKLRSDLHRHPDVIAVLNRSLDYIAGLG